MKSALWCFWVNSNRWGHLKSGYLLVPWSWSPSSLSKRSCGGLTTLSSLGLTKNANDLLSLSLFTTALCRQLLYLPLHSAYCKVIATTKSCQKQLQLITDEQVQPCQNRETKYFGLVPNTYYILIWFVALYLFKSLLFSTSHEYLLLPFILTLFNIDQQYSHQHPASIKTN